MTETITQRMTERMTERMEERMAERMAERMTKIMAERMTKRTLGELGSHLLVPLAIEIVFCYLQLNAYTYLFQSAILCMIKFCSKNVSDGGVPEEKVELLG
eukprot:sb/3478518/